jgi:group I intron endonuclease
MMCIYLRTNKINGKQYVGQTVNFEKRQNEWNCNKAIYAGSYINNAREKYGIENWVVKVLRECDTQDELDEWEKYYIKTLNTKRPFGYNLTDGGGGLSGYCLSEETKEKISKSLKGKYTGEKSPSYGKRHTEEAKHKMSKSHIGKKLSEEHKRKIGEKSKGRKLSQQSKDKISKANKGNVPWIKGKHLSNETREKISASMKGKKKPTIYKKVYQYSLDCKLIRIWDRAPSVDEGFMRNKICECCNGIRKTHKGYRWSYKPL